MISYYSKETVEQKITEIPLYNLQGTFPEVIEKLRTEEEYYTEAAKNGIKVYAYGKYPYHGYVDEAKFKIVKFDKIFLKVMQGDEKTLEIWGIRNILPEEKLALEKLEAKAKEEKDAKEKQDFERLKKKFEGENV